MKTNAKKFENILKIFDILSECRWITSKALSEQLDVSERTVFRYINEIDIAFSPYEIIERSYEGYRLYKHEFINILNKKDDYFALAAIGASPYGNIINEKIKYPDEFLKKVLERIELKNHISNEHIKIIFKSFLNNLSCNVDYQNQDKKESFNILPLKLVSKDNIFYLMTRDLDNKRYILLALDKISDLKYNNVRVNESEIKEYIDYINSAWGIMITDKIIEVSFEADSDIVKYFETNPLHQSQNIDRKEDKSIVYMKIHNSKEFIRWTLRFGRNIKIISPKEVIEELLEYISSMEEFYK